MKQTFYALLIVSCFGCAHVPPANVAPEFSQLKHLRYMTISRRDTPAVQMTATFDFDIYLSQGQCWMQYASAPHVIEAETLDPSSQTFTAELFRCDIPPELAHELYNRLREDCIKTLPSDDTPQTEYFFGFLMLFSTTRSPAMWFFRERPRSNERSRLHEEIVSFVKARIAEHPDQMETRQVGQKDMTRKREITEQTPPGDSLKAAPEE